MTQVHDAVTVAEEWVATTLLNDAGVAAEVGDRVWPAMAPDGTATPFVTHDIGDATETTRQLASPPNYRFGWDVTVWVDGYSRQAARPAVKAVLNALAGPEMRGLPQSRFVSVDGTVWVFETRYRTPMAAPAVPAEVGEPGIWQRVVHRVELLLWPAD